MPERTCTVDECQRPHLARGMCSSHYGAWHRRTHGRKSNGTQVEITCIVCGTKHMAWRPDGKFCSDACKGKHYVANGIGRKRIKSPLPIDHPVMVLIAEAKAVDAERRRLARAEAQRSKFVWRTARECPGCACWFTPLHTPNAICCSKRCQRRVHRWRRNAAEADAVGAFTWSQFMAIARRFGYCCAYCGDKPGQLDPDHVVPLSRGGYNSTTNLLPSCRACNGDKRDLLLDEWATDRHARGRPPRMTNWPAEDKRYWHLTQVASVYITERISA